MQCNGPTLNPRGNKDGVARTADPTDLGGHLEELACCLLVHALALQDLRADEGRPSCIVHVPETNGLMLNRFKTSSLAL